MYFDGTHHHDHPRRYQKSVVQGMESPATNGEDINSSSSKPAWSTFFSAPHTLPSVTVFSFEVAVGPLFARCICIIMNNVIIT